MKNKAFLDRWLRTFAADVPKSDLKKYVTTTGNFIWHVFSWELVPNDKYLKADAARKAYDDADKCGARYVVIYPEETKPTELTEDMFTASSLDAFDEIYVVGKDFGWTYIKTHEKFCGPYFCRIK